MNQLDMLRILQINLNRCVAAVNLLEMNIEEYGTDLVIGREPNKKRDNWEPIDIGQQKGCGN